MMIAAVRQEYSISVDTFDDPETGAEYDTVFYHGPEQRLPSTRLGVSRDKIVWHHTTTFAGRNKGISAYHFYRDYVIVGPITRLGEHNAHIERWWIVNLCPDESCRKVTAVGRSIREAYANAYRAYREYLRDKVVQS